MITLFSILSRIFFKIAIVSAIILSPALVMKTLFSVLLSSPSLVMNTLFSGFISLTLVMNTLFSVLISSALVMNTLFSALFSPAFLRCAFYLSRFIPSIFSLLTIHFIATLPEDRGRFSGISTYALLSYVLLGEELGEYFLFGLASILLALKGKEMHGRSSLEDSWDFCYQIILDLARLTKKKQSDFENKKQSAFEDEKAEVAQFPECGTPPSIITTTITEGPLQAVSPPRSPREKLVFVARRKPVRNDVRQLVLKTLRRRNAVVEWKTQWNIDFSLALSPVYPKRIYKVTTPQVTSDIIEVASSPKVSLVDAPMAPKDCDIAVGDGPVAVEKMELSGELSVDAVGLGETLAPKGCDTTAEDGLLAVEKMELSGELSGDAVGLGETLAPKGSDTKVEDGPVAVEKMEISKELSMDTSGLGAILAPKGCDTAVEDGLMAGEKMELPKELSIDTSVLGEILAKGLKEVSVKSNDSELYDENFSAIYPTPEESADKRAFAHDIFPVGTVGTVEVIQSLTSGETNKYETPLEVADRMEDISIEMVDVLLEFNDESDQQPLCEHPIQTGAPHQKTKGRSTTKPRHARQNPTSARKLKADFGCHDRTVNRHMRKHARRHRTTAAQEPATSKRKITHDYAVESLFDLAMAIDMGRRSRKVIAAPKSRRQVASVVASSPNPGWTDWSAEAEDTSEPETVKKVKDSNVKVRDLKPQGNENFNPLALRLQQVVNNNPSKGDKALAEAADEKMRVRDEREAKATEREQKRVEEAAEKLAKGGRVGGLTALLAARKPMPGRRRR